LPSGAPTRPGRGSGPRRFKIKPMHLKLRPGLDRTSLNRLVDELEDAELHSNDADFGRFPGLRWINPLKR
jgi:hypothetical protein